MSMPARSGNDAEGAPTQVHFLAQLPPPIHGVTVVSKRVFGLMRAAPGVTVEHLWSGGAASMGDIGTKSVGKLLQFAKLLTRLAWRAASGRRAHLAYLTLTPWSHAALRDGLLARVAGLGADRVLVHLHTEGLAQVLADKGMRATALRWLLKGSELIAIVDETARAAETSGVFARVNRLPNTVADPGLQPQDSSAMPAGSDADKALHCAYLGNYDTRKGIYEFIAMVGALRAQGHKIHGHIAGGETRFVSLTDLTNAAQSAGIAEHITLHGFVDEAAKSALLRRCPVFVYPTRHDHAPLVLLEAMAHGCVPVTLDAGGIRSMMGEALCANVGDHTASADETRDWLVARVSAYARNPADLAADRRAARQRYQDHFGQDVFNDRLQAILALQPVHVRTARKPLFTATHRVSP
ncbi:MAG: glycosyltransferase [Pseudomonadota bacterium]